jgi:sugar/nucleoside kinase (ribokinase family)
LSGSRGEVALVVGDVTLDVGPGGLVPGGSAYYAAHALAALGAQARVLAAAGLDFPPEALRAATPGAIEARIVAAPLTARFSNVHRGGRRAQRALAPAPPLAPSALPDAWREADLLLLAPVLGELAPGAFAQAVRAPKVGLCVQGLLRDVAPDGRVLPRPLAAGGALAGVDVAFLGDDEAAAQPDLADALHRVVPLVAWTHGPRGSELRTRDRTLRAGVHPAREVDPTGAGDVFAAAFLLALARGGALEDALRLGAAAASIVVEGVGGDALARIGEAFERAAAVRVE